MDLDMATRDPLPPDAETGEKTPPVADVAEDNPRFQEWLVYKSANYGLLIYNVFSILVSLAVFIIGVQVIREHVDDLNRNNAFPLPDTAPTPCGLPTPDVFHLLQALGNVENGGIAGALVEPDYSTWIGKVKTEMCDPIISGATQSGVDADGSYNADNADELLFFSELIGDSRIRPTQTEADTNDATTMDTKLALFEDRACLVKTTDGIRPFYDAQERHVYGDLKERVAIAYVTAMPAFVRFSLNPTCLGDNTPFTTACRHGVHALSALDAAADDAKYLVTKSPAGLPSFTDMLYRLFALSLVGYWDRRHNGGACFKNLAVEPAIDFCTTMVDGLELKESINGQPADMPVTQSKESIDNYKEQRRKTREARTCTRTTAPPPPPPRPPQNLDHPDSASDVALSEFQDVCAHTLQYGLLEQGRLFGVPDPVGVFVVDSRADRSLHFIAKEIYSRLYTNRVGSRDAFKYPSARLEAYIAYRLASTSIWGSIVASIVGFLGFQCFVPALVFVFRLLGIKTVGGKQIVLARPKGRVPMTITVFFAAITGFWLIWNDPAVYSDYPVTTSCSDWTGSGSNVASGAWVNYWGKRRFDRNGIPAIGILLWFHIALYLLYVWFLRNAISSKKRNEHSVRTTKHLACNFYAVLFCNLLVVIFLSALAADTGRRWFNLAKNQKDTTAITKELGNDCLLVVFFSFWLSGVAGCLHAKWSTDPLSLTFKLGWAALTVFLVWLPMLQASNLLESELETAFQGTSNPEEDEQKVRKTYYTLVLILLGVITLLVVHVLYKLWKDTPPGNDGFAVDRVRAYLNARYARRKGTTPLYTRGAAIVRKFANAKIAEDDVAGAADGGARVDRFRFRLEGVRTAAPGATSPFGAHTLPQADRRTGAAYGPLLKLAY